MGMFADRMSQVSVSATLKVAAEAERLRRAGHSVVDFSAGEPDFPTPEHVKAAAKAAIDANFTRYTAAAGIPELREAICARYKRDYGVDITAAEVLVTVGGKQALFNSALALFNPGDEVITHAPYWPTIPEQVKLVGAVPVIVPTSSTDGFRVSAESVIGAITPKTKAIILNSPGNPTGALIDERRGRDCRGSGAPRHLGGRRSLLRAADLRAGAAQSAEDALRSSSRQDGAVRVGVERATR
jgi:aspartate aminotransferase